LSEDAWLDAHDLDVQVKNGEVTIKGTVHNREEKRRAEDIAASVSGAQQVHNQIRIEASQGASSRSATNASSEKESAKNK
jgi:osmotically-inducible protein OsmY